MSAVRVYVLALVFFLIVKSDGSAAIVLYGSESVASGRLFGVNAELGEATPIGPTTFLPGLEFRNNGMLYGTSSSLRTVNPTTGAFTTVGALPELIVSIAFSPNDTLFGVSNNGNTLYELNPTTGASIRSVPLTGTVHSSGIAFPGEINGIDFGPDGTLYGIGVGLYQINPITGVASRITPMGQQVSGNLFHDLDFGVDGQLRSVTAVNQTVLVSDLYVINPLSGIGQFNGSTGYAMGGLASIPEPSAFHLSITAIVVAMLFLRKSPTINRSEI